MRRAFRSLAALFVATLLATCGSRTGLEVPPENRPQFLYWTNRFDATGQPVRPDVGLVTQTSDRDGFIARRLDGEMPAGWIEMTVVPPLFSGPRLSPDGRLAGMTLTTAPVAGRLDHLAMVFDTASGREELRLSTSEIFQRYLRSDFAPCRAMVAAAARVGFAGEGRVAPGGTVIHVTQITADGEGEDLRFVGYAIGGRPVLRVIPLHVIYEARAAAGDLVAQTGWNNLTFYVAFPRQSDGSFGAPDWCDTRRPLMLSDPPQVYTLSTTEASGHRRVFSNGNEVRDVRTGRTLLMLGEASGVHGGWRVR